MLVGYLDLTASQAIEVFSLLVEKISHDLRLETGITGKFQNYKNIVWASLLSPISSERREYIYKKRIFSELSKA